MEVANIEKYMPTVYQAEILVRNNLEMNRAKGLKVFKIIHGYGSTGKGGALRTGIRHYLDQLKGAKIIADYIPRRKLDSIWWNNSQGFRHGWQFEKGQRSTVRWIRGLQLL